MALGAVTLQDYTEALSAISARTEGLHVDDLLTEDQELAEDELLVEEISIDGMCGVY